MSGISIRKLLFPFIIVLIVLSLYWQTQDFLFITFDDYLYIHDNEFVKTGLSSKNLKWAFGFSDKTTYWHPLSWISHMIDVELFGLNAGLHHLMNVIFHTINVLLLFSLLLSLCKNVWISCFVALLFAIHPINVESVAWVTERKNLLSTLFLFLSIFSYLSYVQRPHPWRYFVLLTCFALGLLAKPIIVTLPMLLLLLDFWPLNRFRLLDQSSQQIQNDSNASRTGIIIKLIIEKIPLFILSIASTYLTIISQPKLQAVTESIPLLLRIENTLLSYAKYVVKFVLPFNLTVYYPFPKIVPAWQYLESGLFLAAVTYFGIRNTKRRPYFLMGWAWYCITLLPSSGIIQSGLWPAMADRWAYLPIIGLLIIITHSIDYLRGILRTRKYTAAVTGIMLLTFLSALTWRQISYWKDSATLFGRALEIDSHNWLAHSHLGVAFSSQNKLPEAVKHYEKSLKAYPNNKTVHYNLGRALYAQEKYHEAIKSFRYAIVLDQNYLEAHINLANTLMKIGDYMGALENYSKVLSIKNDNYRVLHNIGILYDKQGRLLDAVNYFQQSIRIAPTYSESHYSLGIVLEKQGDYENAIRSYQAALNLEPENITFKRTLAKAYTFVNRFNDAENIYKEILTQNPSNADIFNELGIVYAKTERYNEAKEYFLNAQKLNPENSQISKNLEQLRNLMNHAVQ